MNCSATWILSGWYVNLVCIWCLSIWIDFGLQRHLLELRLPRGSKDAPDTFIALIIATINLLSGKLLPLIFSNEGMHSKPYFIDTVVQYVASFVLSVLWWAELADCHKERKEIRDKSNMELRGAKAIMKMDKVTEYSASSSLKCKRQQCNVCLKLLLEYTENTHAQICRSVSSRLQVVYLNVVGKHIWYF